MNTNKPPYPSLQRHRRKSSQPSPTSPSFPRRMLDRPPRIVDPFSPVESLSAHTANSNSPSIDVDVPSPALDLPISTLPYQDVVQGHGIKRLPVRISEQSSRPGPHVLPNVTRPFTSDAIDTKYGLHTGPSNGHGFDQGFRTSPNASNSRFGDYSERLSSESAGRYADSHSPNLRSFGPSSHTSDRAFQDDHGPSKLNTGKKSRLNLLNPMSLLARRRSSQNQNDQSNMSINTMHVPALPDNFDPSIRGTITHDFSAPRTRRNHSYGGDGNQFDPNRRDFLSPGQPTLLDRTTPRLQPSSGPTPTHSPMFKEHFQDDRLSLRPGETGYLHNMANQHSAAATDLGTSMPAFAKKLPLRLPDQLQSDHLADTSILDRPLPEKPAESSPPLPKEPTEAPPPPPKRTPSPVVNLPPAAVLPKHMTSTSSRFSFQLSGQASSAQEKLLEEKHKQFQSSKRVSNLSRREDVGDDDYDDYDFDADDGLEECIPGVNADYEEDDGFDRDVDTPAYGLHAIENLTSLQNQSLQGFHFTPQSLTFSPTSTNHASQPTPRDDHGFAIGIADSRDSSDYMQRPMDQEPASASEQAKVDFLGGLGITASTTMELTANPQSNDRKHAFDDEDLYFDDGEFADHEYESATNTFDEDIFDDETKIRDIPAENARKYEAAVQAAGHDGEVKMATSRSSGKSSAIPIDHLKSDQDPATIIGLTEDNLAAYHDALAHAAHEAAANGKFRNVSFSQASDDGTSQSQLGIISDESRFSYNNTNINHSTIAEDDGFPFDDSMDDDLMIAEANAEALENDDEGFYGQEFGFYARAHTKDSAEMVNGGFFANRGSNGVKRSHSGRGNFQEPSLTPITERSEWSTRNSVASLQIPPGLLSAGGAGSLPSPGIAQLLELDSPGFGDDSDMTLSALMKLRRGAFGGSSTSVSSMGTAGHAAAGSPLGHPGHIPFSPQDSHAHGGGHHRLAQSGLGVAGIPESEEEEEEDQRGGEETVAQNMPLKDMEPVQGNSPITPEGKGGSVSSRSASVASPVSVFGDGGASAGGLRRGHHSHTSSGAESVSYAKDLDGRWVLERRRTGEDGGTEVEREWLAGGRI